MQLIPDRLLQALNLQRKGAGATALDGALDPFTTWLTGKKDTAEKAMSLYTGWVYACVRAIAEELANIDLKLMMGEEEKGEHPVLDALYGVNDQMTGYELFYLTAAHWELAGNAYWWLEGATGPLVKPDAIHPLNPKNMRVLKAEDGTKVLGYEYRRGSFHKIYQPYEILHLKAPDPNDILEGLGTTQAIMPWIEADNAATEFNRKFFQSGTRIGGFLESETANTPEQLEYLKRSFRQAAEGLENAYKTLALPKGTKFTAGQESPKDMDFANLMTVMRDRILAGYRVPRTILGITDDVNRANAEATHYIFMARTIKPKMKQLVAQLNEFFVPRYGKGIWLDFVDPVPENRTELMQEMAAATGNQPVLSPNEARERYFGEAPITGGEYVRGSFGNVPIGAPAAEKPKKTGPGKRGSKAPVHHKHGAAKRREEMAGNAADKAVAALQAVLQKDKAVREKRIKDMTPDDWAHVYAAAMVRVEPYAQKIATDMRGINADQKKEVVANLAEAIKSFDTKTKAINPAKLLNKGKWVTATVDILGPTLRDLMEKEGLEALELIGAGGTEFMTEETLAALTRGMELLAETYTDTTVDLLRAKLEEGLEAGASMDELTKLVSDVYQWRDEVGAERVARTEVVRVANEANRVAWKASGVVKSIKWYTGPDPCEHCQEMAGKVADINDSFLEQGEELVGADGGTMTADYDDVDGPPLHPNCQCYTQPEDISI